MDEFLEHVAPVAIDSPCILVCMIDPASGLCLGCARTLDEIARWSSGTPEWRAAVMAELAGRENGRDIGPIP